MILEPHSRFEWFPIHHPTQHLTNYVAGLSLRRVWHPRTRRRSPTHEASSWVRPSGVWMRLSESRCHLGLSSGARILVFADCGKCGDLLFIRGTPPTHTHRYTYLSIYLSNLSVLSIYLSIYLCPPFMFLRLLLCLTLTHSLSLPSVVLIHSHAFSLTLTHSHFDSFSLTLTHSHILPPIFIH